VGEDSMDEVSGEVKGVVTTLGLDWAREASESLPELEALLLVEE
jgi:hypothetical protein